MYCCIKYSFHCIYICNNSYLFIIWEAADIFDFILVRMSVIINTYSPKLVSLAITQCVNSFHCTPLVIWNLLIWTLKNEDPYLSYSAKWWQEKTLVDLANPEQFVKVLPTQIYVSWITRFCFSSPPHLTLQTCTPF